MKVDVYKKICSVVEEAFMCVCVYERCEGRKGERHTEDEIAVFPSSVRNGLGY